MAFNTGLLYRVAKLKVYLGNTIGFVSEVKYAIFVAIVLKQWRPATTLTELLLLLILLLAVGIFLGWVDVKIVRFTPTVQEINTRENNLYFKDLEKTLNNNGAYDK